MLLRLPIFAAFILFLSCNDNAPVESTADSSTTNTDTLIEPEVAKETVPNKKLAYPVYTLLKKAIVDDMYKTALGKLAASNASNNDVKIFSRTMETESSNELVDINKLAEKNQVLLPIQLPDSLQYSIDSLKGVKGSAFEKKYFDLLVPVLESEGNFYETNAADSTQQIDMKIFAAKSLLTSRRQLMNSRLILNNQY